MEDIIDIIVTETTNTIEITAQPNDEIIDVNIIDNREDVTLNVTPTVVEININSLTGNFGVEWGDIDGTLSNQTDLQNALNLKADLVDGKVPSSQLPSYVDDVVEVATFSALPATGEIGKIYVILDTNKIYRWSGSVYVEIADSTAVWGAITGTLSNQTDLQNALNAKFDDPTGDTTQYIAGDGSLVTFPIAGQAGTLVREVRNTTGATLTKGTIVYISGATGNKPTVSKAIATGDATSAQTFGMCQANIANNANGYVVCVGDLTGLDTSAFTEGNQLYLSSTTAGTYTTTKQLAPNHLVYIGVVTRAHPTQGQIEVNIQNGYELYELHDVSITSEANNQGLFYEASTDLWKNKSIATVLGYTPQAQLNGTGFVKASGTTITYDNTSYLPLTGGTLSGALNGTSVSLSSSITASALFVTGMTAGSGAIYHTGSRLTFANYNASGTLHFEVNGGVGALTLNSDKSATFENSVTATSFIKTSGTSAQFLKADGSIDSSTYLTTGTASSTYLALAGGTLTGAVTGTRLVLAQNSADITLSIVNAGTGRAFSVLGTSYFSADISFGSLSNGVLKANAFGALGIAIAGTDYQAPLSGTGFVKISGSTISYDNSTYLTTSSASSTYLPLAGGTLTGALSGTSASFSGLTVENNQNGSTWVISKNTNSGAGAAAGFLMTNNTGDLGAISLLSSGNSPANGLFIRTLSTNSLILGTNSTANLTIASTGAATFSSSVSATSVALNGSIANSADAATLTIKQTSTSYNNGIYLERGGERNGYHMYIGGGLDSLNFRRNYFGTQSDVMSLTRDGNVGIGLTNPDAKLFVKGSSGAQLMIDYQATNTNYYDADTHIFRSYASATYAERMRITSGGDFLIGKTSSNWTVTGTQTEINGKTLGVTNSSGGDNNLFLRKNGAIGNVAAFYYDSTIVGYIAITSVSTSYNTTSDYRLKEDLKPIKGLEIVNKIKVYDYKWKSEDSRMDGVLAHELAEVLPYAVHGVKDGEQMQGVDYSKIVPVMVQAIKELKTKIETLENK